jgi:hypothetical protein
VLTSSKNNILIVCDHRGDYFRLAFRIKTAGWHSMGSMLVLLLYLVCTGASGSLWTCLSEDNLLLVESNGAINWNSALLLQ